MFDKRLTAAGALLLFVFVLAASPVPVLAQAKEKPAQKQEKVFIPKEIQALLQQGLETRQGVQDMPFDLFTHYFFPAMQNYHVAFLFTAKNSAFGYAPPAVAPDAPVVEGQLEAKVNVFLQFRQFENDQPSQVVREVYVPTTFVTSAADFDTEAEDWYSTGYPMPAGRYLLAMAITSPDLKTVGIDYYEFTIEDMTALQNALATTPVFFVKGMEQVQQPEVRTEVHRGFFTYSVLHIVPNPDNVIAPGDTIEIFFYVFGAQPSGDAAQPGKAALEIAYEVKKEDQTVIRWEPQKYDYALISQPLPMKQTVLIKDEEGERTEQRDLEPGAYQMIISIKDTISGAELAKTIDFEVK